MPRVKTVHGNVWHFKSFLRTQQAFAQARALSSAHRPLSLVSAESGAGKTFCAEYYAEHTEGVRIAVCPPKHLSTPRTLLLAIAEAVGLAHLPRHTMDLQTSLRNHLAPQKCFVILDEADRLRPADMDLIRDLAEQSGAAFCFLGCPSLLNVIAQVPPTQRRVTFRYEIQRAEEDEVRGELGKRFDQEDVVGEIISQAAGNIGHLERLLAVIDSRPGDKPPSARDIRAAARRYLLQAKAVA